MSVPATAIRRSAVPESFGELIKRLRVGQYVTVQWTNRLWHVNSAHTGPMSQNELARRAGIDSAYVNRLERGSTKGRPYVGYEVAVRLGEALGLDGDAQEAFIYAAGHAPPTDWQREYLKLQRKLERMERAVRTLTAELGEEV